MTRKELIATIAKEQGFTQVEAGRQVETVLDAIIAGLETEGVVDLFGFGKFIKEHKPAKSGVAMGKPYTSAAKNVAKFKPSKTLTDSIQ